MNFSYNWLQSFFKKKLPKPKELAELLTMRLAEVEEVKKSGGDYIINIDVRPNRAFDCFSHLGIAREISAITGFPLIMPSVNFAEDKKIKTSDFISAEVKNKKVCPRYTLKVIDGVKVGNSPKWMQEFLKSCGLRPINNIVDIANYVMLETGQPLHAFDKDKIDGEKILVRFAKEREKIITLDEQKIDLDPEVLLIADIKKPLAIAGIKGGKLPEIDKKTRTIILESANFDQLVIRKGSRKIDLRTDASLRFEHGLDPELTEFAINRAAFLVKKIAGGKVAKGLVDVYPEKKNAQKIILDCNYVTKLLGITVSKQEIIKILKSLEFGVKEIKKDSLEVLAPTRRLDVSYPEDLIEEVGRIVGYEKIKPDFPVSLLIPPKRNLEIFWEDTIKNILKEAGFSETYNYTFIGDREVSNFSFKADNLIELKNPISLEYKYLRPSLIPYLLKNIKKNLNYQKEIKLFELGKIFSRTKGQPKNKEILALTGVVTGEEFYSLKGIIDNLLNKIGISDIWYDEHNPTSELINSSAWHPKKAAEIKVGNLEIGFLGEISPKILNKLEIEEKVIAFDIDFEKLLKNASEEQEYSPLSRFPSAVRDIAVLVPRKTKVADILNNINEAGGKLVRDVDLFDIYEGEELPQGKKNLAFHIIYQSEEKTLSSEEIEEIQNKIIKSIEKVSGWEIRK